MLWDYFKVMRKIRDSEFKNVDDLLASIRETNKLKVDLAQLEATLKTRELEFENIIKKLENEFSLEKLKLKQEMDIRKLTMDKEREIEILKTQQEVGRIRQEFLEKNYGDLKTEAGQAFDRSLKAVGIFLDKIQYKQTNSNQPIQIEEHDVTVK